MSDALKRSTYLNKNIGDYSTEIEVNGSAYTKVDDLRYGTNPHQTAAFYKPAGASCPIGDMEVLKNGKSGLSQTNLEDISYALNIVKFFDEPACAVMKHVNPSGAATATTALDAYSKARDCDPRAAFGSTIALNVTLDEATAKEIMTSFVECVVAPEVTPEALAVFNDRETYKINSHIRILKSGNLNDIPKYLGEAGVRHNTIKTLCDGSIVMAEPLLTNIKSIADLKPASGTSKALGEVVSTVEATEQEKKDLVAAWYVNISVRSNGVIFVKNGEAISVGTGEQDRVGAIEQAIAKFKTKYEGEEEMEGSVMASDGFFPFADGVETAAAAGVTAIISPAGSIKDADVVKRANELGVALYHAPERIFSHH
ncbi:MAG: IMP cyclohydrolase [Lentisphaeraceae bacterium]|nr:IMP cyclohydrolase [Lentisphaeraceae bacterium]